MRNSVTPPVTAAATIQSVSAYCFWEIRIPQIMTGIILKLFPSICTGKDTHFKASYWQDVAATLLREMAKYFQRGALLTGDSWLTATMETEKMIAQMRLHSTRKILTLKSSPP